MIAAIPFRTFPQISLGPVTLRTFGLFVAAGILVGVWAFLRYARDRDLDAELLSRLAWWVILLGIVGSRLLFVVTHWSEFADDPLSALAVWQGGLQFSGAFLIAIVVIVWFTRRYPEMPGLVVSDGIVYGSLRDSRSGASDASPWASTWAPPPASRSHGSTSGARRESPSTAGWAP